MSNLIAEYTTVASIPISIEKFDDKIIATVGKKQKECSSIAEANKWIREYVNL